MLIITGWFFLYRGNGYGAYQSLNEAIEMFRIKHHRSPDNMVHPVYGTVHIENKKLINFERKTQDINESQNDNQHDK